MHRHSQFTVKFSSYFLVVPSQQIGEEEANMRPHAFYQIEHLEKSRDKTVRHNKVTGIHSTACPVEKYAVLAPQDINPLICETYRFP